MSETNDKKPVKWSRAVWAAVAVLLVVATILWVRWPFTEQRIIRALEGATKSRVRVQGFRTTFFPEPGCTLEKVTISRVAKEPLAYAEQIQIRASWPVVLTFQKRLRLLQTRGLRIQIPREVPPPIQTGGSGGLGDTVVGEWNSDGTTVEFDGKAGEPARFAFHELRLREVGAKQRVVYATVVDLPHPPGRLRSSGSIGPFSSDERGETPVVGSFELQNASLDRYKGLAGSIQAQGKFEGALESIRVTGTATASGFEVNRSNNPVEVRSVFEASVNGRSGDVKLDKVDASFLDTHLSVSGSIAGKGGKLVSLDFVGERAQIEDLLTMFTRSQRPALEGPIHLRAHAELPPGSEPFLRRLLLDGNFVIRRARWTRPTTQVKVNRLSARARGDKEQVEDRPAQDVDSVLSQLKGSVSVKSGLARLSDVSFQVPGAVATGGGTYNLISKFVDLRGKVSMAADVSEATSGWKSFLLKPFDALFRRNKSQGAVLPVSVIGQYPRPEYKVGLKK